MTRNEAIETVSQVMVEMDKNAGGRVMTLGFPECLVAALISLEILKVDDASDSL